MTGAWWTIIIACASGLAGTARAATASAEQTVTELRGHITEQRLSNALPVVYVRIPEVETTTVWVGFASDQAPIDRSDAELAEWYWSTQPVPTARYSRDDIQSAYEDEETSIGCQLADGVAGCTVEFVRPFLAKAVAMLGSILEAPVFTPLDAKLARRALMARQSPPRDELMAKLFWRGDHPLAFAVAERKAVLSRLTYADLLAYGEHTRRTAHGWFAIVSGPLPADVVQPALELALGRLHTAKELQTTPAPPAPFALARAAAVADEPAPWSSISFHYYSRATGPREAAAADLMRAIMAIEFDPAGVRSSQSLPYLSATCDQYDACHIQVTGRQHGKAADLVAAARLASTIISGLKRRAPPVAEVESQKIALLELYANKMRAPLGSQELLRETILRRGSVRALFDDILALGQVTPADIVHQAQKDLTDIAVYGSAVTPSEISLAELQTLVAEHADK